MVFIRASLRGTEMSYYSGFSFFFLLVLSFLYFSSHCFFRLFLFNLNSKKPILVLRLAFSLLALICAFSS